MIFVEKMRITEWITPEDYSLNRIDTCTHEELKNLDDNGCRWFRNKLILKRILNRY